MLSKKITYTDFLGNERTEEFIFNLTETEITQLELKTDGMLTSKLKKLTDSINIPELMYFFDMIIEKSYGVISPDGRKLIKTKEVYDDFRFTNAYDVFMKELLSSDEKAANFINSILPEDLVRQVEEAKKNNDPRLKDYQVVSEEKSADAKD